MLLASCSGSMNVVQPANLAIGLDRLGLAELWCVVGVGGDVKPLVHKATRALVHRATRGYPIIAITGCPLGRVERGLAANDVEPGA